MDVAHEREREREKSKGHIYVEEGGTEIVPLEEGRDGRGGEEKGEGDLLSLSPAMITFPRQGLLRPDKKLQFMESRSRRGFA